MYFKIDHDVVKTIETVNKKQAIIKDNGAIILPAGKYVISDPCYCFKDATWQEMLNSNWPDGTPLTEVNDGYVVAFSTRYGDGEYNDNNGNDYSVDFGMIGVISVNAIECRDDLKIVEFDNDFECCAENGVLYFDHIVIDTAHVDEDQEDENEGWDDEEDSH